MQYFNVIKHIYACLKTFLWGIKKSKTLASSSFWGHRMTFLGTWLPRHSHQTAWVGSIMPRSEGKIFQILIPQLTAWYHDVTLERCTSENHWWLQRVFLFQILLPTSFPFNSPTALCHFIPPSSKISSYLSGILLNTDCTDALVRLSPLGLYFLWLWKVQTQSVVDLGTCFI